MRQLRRGNEILGPMLFVSSNENNKPLSGRDDVAGLQTWIIHRSDTGSFCFLLLRWRRNGWPRTSIGNKFFGSATCLFHPLLPLLAGEGRVCEDFLLLAETFSGRHD